MDITDRITSIHSRVIGHGDRRPHRIALRHDGSGYTYRTLASRSRRAATVLAGCGLRAGDRVAAAGSEGARFVETLLGCGMIGAVFVPLDDRWDEPIVTGVLADSKAALLVGTGPAGRNLAADVLSADDFDRGVVRSEPAPLPGEPATTGPALLDYTTDAGPASVGVMLTHGDLVAVAERGCAATGLSGRDVTIPRVPVARVATPDAMVLPTLAAGACLILPASPGPAALAALVAEEAVTVFPGRGPASRRDANAVGAPAR